MESLTTDMREVTIEDRPPTPGKNITFYVDLTASPTPSPHQPEPPLKYYPEDLELDFPRPPTPGTMIEAVSTNHAATTGNTMEAHTPLSAVRAAIPEAGTGTTTRRLDPRLAGNKVLVMEQVSINQDQQKDLVTVTIKPRHGPAEIIEIPMAKIKSSKHKKWRVRGRHGTKLNLKLRKNNKIEIFFPYLRLLFIFESHHFQRGPVFCLLAESCFEFRAMTFRTTKAISKNVGVFGKTR